MAAGAILVRLLFGLVVPYYIGTATPCEEVLPARLLQIFELTVLGSPGPLIWFPGGVYVCSMAARQGECLGVSVRRFCVPLPLGPCYLAAFLDVAVCGGSSVWPVGALSCLCWLRLFFSSMQYFCLPVS